MKLLLILLFTLSTQAKENKAYDFLKTEAIKSNKNYKYNQYENIINGSIAFTIGNLGYYTTGSQSLKLAYSGVQTIGILNVGKGIYDFYRPVQDKELYLKLKNTRKFSREKMANDLIQIFAQEERAKRMQLLWSSSLLATQYFINAFSSETEKSLKEVYQFLGGVNLIVIGYSYFYQQKYEKFYYNNISKMPTPFWFKDDATNKVITGIGYQFKF